MDQFKRYSTDSSAESILNFVLVVTLVVGIIISLALIAVGIAALCDSESFEATTDLSSSAFGIIFIIAGIVNFVVSLIGWAMGKLWINVSRNLFKLSSRVESIYNAMPVKTPTPPAPVVETVVSEGTEA